VTDGLSTRIDDRIHEWNVVPDKHVETPHSVLVFGRQASRHVVLKVVKRQGDEWHCGQILEAFGGRRMVRVHAFTDGAALLERLQPATLLADMALSGEDEQATDVLSEVVLGLGPGEPPRVAVPVEDLAKAFQQYLTSRNEQIPYTLVDSAQDAYLSLSASQSERQLLHGDLHHYNVVLDDERGWVAIDPKGLVGELEYEVGAALRNPYERSDLIAERRTIDRRVMQFARTLAVDPDRTLRWAFAQAVLAIVWSVEEGESVDSAHPCLRLARTIESMLAP
jgi:streptomycin 6-kinase